MSKELDPGSDLIEESKDYDDFIVRSFDRWEKKALDAIDKIDIQKFYEYYYHHEDMECRIWPFRKTLGEFLESLFNGINASVFIRGVRKFVGQDMKTGLKSAEEDTEIDIGISSVFNDKVLALSEQELNGYTINGKKWHGMKGVTNELRNDILNSIRDGVIDKESRTELTKRVKDIFKTAKDSQAERIARTETTRFISEGKLQGFKDSGLNGNKTWLSVNCCDKCTDLTAKYIKGIPFDEPFRMDGKEYEGPPLHPNCKCVPGYAIPEKPS